MTSTKNCKTLASSLMLLTIILGITLTYATTENNYNNDTNFLTDISESTHTENGYKTNIIINPNVVGIYTLENGYKLDLAINTHGIGGVHSENGYKLDLIPEKTFPDVPDITVTKITTSKTIVGQEYTIRINVTVSNQALDYETFNITIQANTTTIRTRTITLTSREHISITFTWNTTGVAKGNYTVAAEATILPGETDRADNTLSDGWIFVTIPGDVNGDKYVNIKDAVLLGVAFGSKQGDPNYNPNADINCDGYVNIKDAVIQGTNFGKSWT